MLSQFLGHEGSKLALVAEEPAISEWKTNLPAALINVERSFNDTIVARYFNSLSHLTSPSKPQGYPHDQKISTRKCFGSQVYNSLTERQEQLWRYIKSCERSPSYVEMCDHLGLKSKSGIVRLIEGLEERGYARHIPNRARSVVAIEPDPAGGVLYVQFRGRIS